MYIAAACAPRNLKWLYWLILRKWEPLPYTFIRWFRASKYHLESFLLQADPSLFYTFTGTTRDMLRKYEVKNVASDREEKPARLTDKGLSHCGSCGKKLIIRPPSKSESPSTLHHTRTQYCDNTTSSGLPCDFQFGITPLQEEKCRERTKTGDKAAHKNASRRSKR